MKSRRNAPSAYASKPRRRGLSTGVIHSRPGREAGLTLPTGLGRGRFISGPFAHGADIAGHGRACHGSLPSRGSNS